jgi:plasmid stability protein
MRQIAIRNINATVIEALQRRADACGTSMEQQARRALTKAVGLDPEAAARRLSEIRRLIGRLEGLPRLTICGVTATVTKYDGRHRCQRRAEMGG